MDEVVLVDFNSPAEPFLSRFPEHVQKHPKLKHVVVSRAECAAKAGVPCDDRFIETIARNLAVKACTMDVIVSSNMEDLAPPRRLINQMIAAMPSWQDTAILNRVDLHEPFQSYPNPDQAVTEAGCGLRLEDLPLGPLDMMVPSRIGQCGDFQMAHRKMWEEVGFSAAMIGRQFADTMLQVSWLNRGGSIHIFSAPVYHVDHARNNDPGSTGVNQGLTLHVEEQNGKHVIVNKGKYTVP